MTGSRLTAVSRRSGNVRSTDAHSRYSHQPSLAEVMMVIISYTDDALFCRYLRLHTSALHLSFSFYLNCPLEACSFCRSRPETAQVDLIVGHLLDWLVPSLDTTKQHFRGSKCSFAKGAAPPDWQVSHLICDPCTVSGKCLPFQIFLFLFLFSSFLNNSNLTFVDR